MTLFPIASSQSVARSSRHRASVWRWGAVLCVVALCRTGRPQEPLPAPDGAAVVAAPVEPAPGRPPGSEAALPTVGEQPPMYIADPLNDDGLAGIPVGAAADMLPNWPRWFAGASGLVMTRTLPAGTATVQPSGGVQLSTSNAAATWPGGVDLHIGRWFGPRQQHAVEFIYWGVYGIGSADTVTASSSASIDAIPQASGVVVGATPASAWLTNSAAQQISRSDLVNDVEINWIYSLWERPEFLSQDPATPSRRFNLMWLAGFRFFELEDVLTQTSFSGSGAPGTLDLGVATNNNLYGAQVGAFLFGAEVHDRRQLDHEYDDARHWLGHRGHVCLRRTRQRPLDAGRILLAWVCRHRRGLGRDRSLDALDGLPRGGCGQHRAGR